MRHTFLLGFDDRHALMLDDLSGHFQLSAEDTLRLAVRLTHARIDKPDVLVPVFKPRADRHEWDDDADHSPE